MSSLRCLSPGRGYGAKGRDENYKLFFPDLNESFSVPEKLLHASVIL